MIHFAIIGDDLSGSNDTAVMFSNQGYKSCVLNYPQGSNYELENYEICAVSTNSREISRDKAKTVVSEACRYLKAAGVSRLYKKIDSTWRGHIGAELEAVLEEFGFNLCIICSAYPKLGRVVENGYMSVNGVPLHESPIARDPGFPINESYLPKLLAEQTTLPVQMIDREIVAQGPAYLTDYIRNLTNKQKCLVLIDAINDEDLDTIANINESELPPFLFTGSAGLLQAITKTKRSPIVPVEVPPVAIIVGSAFPKNLKQVDYLIQTGLAEEILLDPLCFVSPKDFPINYEDIMAKGHNITARKQNLILKTHANMDRVKELSAQKGLSNLEMAHIIAQGIQIVAKKVLQEFEFAGLMVTGGTTALYVLDALEGVGIEVIEEVEPGVPYGTILGGQYAGMGIVTKAGGFGSEQVFVNSVEYLKRKFRQKRDKE